MLKKLTVLIFALLLAMPLALLPMPAKAATSVAVTSPSSGSTSTGSSFTVTGTATANRTIAVKVNGSVAGTTTSNSSGNWSLNVTGQAAGAKTIEATASTELMYTNILNTGSFSSSRMSRINTLTNTQESSFSIFGASAFPITWKPNPSFTKAYGVAPYLNSGTVWVMDLVNGSTSTFTLPGTGQRGASVAYNSDGTKVYITDNANTDVIVYNTSNEAQIGSAIPVGSAPHSNAKRPGHNEVWIDNSTDNTISVINTVTDTVTNTYATGASPNGLAFSLDGSLAYVGVSAGIAVINASTGATIQTMTGSATAEVLVLNNAGTRLYASHPTSNTVDVFDTASRTLLSTITVGTGPWGMAVTSDDSRLYVTNPNLLGSLNGTTISVVNTSSNTVVDTLTPGGGAPFFIYAAPPESATTSTNFTLQASGDGLADTGDSTTYIALFSLTLLLAGCIGLKSVIYRQT